MAAHSPKGPAASATAAIAKGVKGLKHLPWWAWLLIAAAAAVVVYLIWNAYSGGASATSVGPAQVPSYTNVPVAQLSSSAGGGQGTAIATQPAPTATGAFGTSASVPKTAAPAAQVSARGAGVSGGFAPAVSSASANLAARTAGPTAPKLVRRTYAVGNVAGVPVVYHSRQELLNGSYVAPPAGSGPQYPVSVVALEKGIRLQKTAYAAAVKSGNSKAAAAAHLRASEARQQLRIMGINIPAALQA